MSNRPLPSHNNNNLYPQTSTFLSSKLERHISNPTHSTSPSQLFNNSSIPLQNRYNHPSSTSRQLNFETPTTNFSAVQSQKLDFSQALNKADNMSQTPNYILHKLKADTDGHMEVEVSDFDLQKENEVLESKCDFFDQLLNEVEIPSQGSKTYVKPIAKEKYLQPKRKTPALMNRRRKENEGVLQEKNTTGAAMKYIKNSEGDVIPDPLTHFTRSNSDVPPTLQSNLILVESKEEMLGDNKYLNNLKDMKHPDKSAQRKQSDEVFPGDNSNHKRNFDNFQNKKSSTGGKSKFAKNLFADFNNDAIVGGGLEGGLFQIPEKAAEYDFSTLESQPKDNKQGNFEIENLDAISKLLNFESETSDEFGYVDGNAAVSPFDAEDRFMSPKKEHFETPIKSFEMNHGSTGKFNLFSTITAKKQSKSNLFSDLMNSTSVTDFSVGEFPSVRKEELSSSSIKETKTKKTLSRFENDFEILEVKLFAKAISYNLKNQTLGSGDVGTVFKCQNKLDGLIYAIKCTNIQLRGEESDDGPAINEAQALASLSALDENPFIVRYYNAWVEDDKLYLAMEHCQNNLRKLKNEHIKFSESMIRQIMRDICTGLKHLHSQRIVHLDIKPENILYSKTKKYKLADLGLSKIALLSNNGDITEGDCRYLAPELLSDFSENNLPDLTKADIFSFGATIFELITGAELPRNGQEWIDIRRGNLHKMDHLNYSNSLKSIIKSMMSSNADARPSAYELLTNFLQSEIELELKWEKKQNKDLKKEIRGLEDQLGLKRKNSM